MRTLAKITLRNFQYYRNLNIEFTKGLNVIWADNNRGKSTIVRAVYWICTNSPSGNWMRRLNGRKLMTAEARMVFDDGTIITRIKGKGKNCYMLDDQLFTKVGRAVPEPIQEVLGTLALNINGQTVMPALQMQDDKPFMVAESGITRGALLNYLTGIDIAGKIKKEFIHEIHKRRSKEKLLMSDVADARKALKQFKGLDTLQEKHRKLTTQVAIVKHGEEQLAAIQDHWGQLVHVRASSKALNNALGAIRPLVAAGMTLATKSAKIALINGQLQDVDAKVEKLQHVDETVRHAKELKQLFDQLNKAETKQRALLDLTDALQEVAHEEESTESSIDKTKRALSKFKTCPTCGSVVKNDSVCVHH